VPSRQLANHPQVLQIQGRNQKKKKQQAVKVRLMTCASKASKSVTRLVN
jgi:hypothetical protein